MIMKQANSFPLLLVVAAMMLCGCATSKWADQSLWYRTDRPINDRLTDVFYIVSTNVLAEKDSTGRDAFIAQLSPAECDALTGEMGFVCNMFGDSLNFFAPYYHQFTMSALALPEADYMRHRADASKDAVRAFRYYLRHLNGGRPFILAGFSQGGMHLVDILRQMKKRDYRRMVVAYSMGYRLSEDDLRHPCVRAAQSADDLGTVVSFNSVTTPSAMWPAVNADAATCINPINFRTDEEPATFTFAGDTLTVRVDTTHHTLLVGSPKIADYRFPILESLCKPGCLHHWDILFYGDALRRNALHRAYQRK